MLIPAIRLAAFRLLASEQVHVALKVDTNVGGVVISIDGKKAGTTPLTRPIERLHEREHTVVVISPFETTRLRLQLKTASDPFGGYQFLSLAQAGSSVTISRSQVSMLVPPAVRVPSSRSTWPAPVLTKYLALGRASSVVS